MMHSAEIITSSAGWTGNIAAELQREMAVQLAMAGSETAMLDARLMMQHVLGCSSAELITQRDRRLTPREQGELTKLLARRCNHEPMAYLLGERDFWDATFRVNAHTLIPRPDSETLIEAILDAMPERQEAFKMLDLGTGTGCLALSLLREYRMAYATAVDNNAATLEIAEENAHHAEVSDRIRFMQSNWFENIEGTFTLIISNPPYIPSHTCDQLQPDVRDYEPRGALDGGMDGLDCYRIIAKRICGHLEVDGYFACEIGEEQEQSVMRIFEDAGLKYRATRNDLSGTPRVLLFQHAKITQG